MRWHASFQSYSQLRSNLWQVKYAQPAAYTVAMLAWSGIEFGGAMDSAGAFAELKSAVRWGADFILQSGSQIGHMCTFHAQVGRGAAAGCGDDACRYDHGYWGRPEDYSRDYAYAAQRRTYTINATHPGTEVWASASAALAAAHMLFRESDAEYAERLLAVALPLYACAASPLHNPSNLFLQDAGLPEASPRTHQASRTASP